MESVIDEFLGLNAMHMVDDIGPRQVEEPWTAAAQSAVGVLFGHTSKRLLDAMVQPVLHYEAKARGCLRCLEFLEQVS